MPACVWQAGGAARRCPGPPAPTPCASPTPRLAFVPSTTSFLRDVHFFWRAAPVVRRVFGCRQHGCACCAASLRKPPKPWRTVYLFTYLHEPRRSGRGRHFPAWRWWLAMMGFVYAHACMHACVNVCRYLPNIIHVFAHARARVCARPCVRAYVRAPRMHTGHQAAGSRAAGCPAGPRQGRRRLAPMMRDTPVGGSPAQRRRGAPPRRGDNDVTAARSALAQPLRATHPSVVPMRGPGALPLVPSSSSREGSSAATPRCCVRATRLGRGLTTLLA